MPTSSYPYDLGKYTRPVTTASKAAQTWFDRGLIWSYGFHHQEAIDCFEKAIQLDRSCAMAYWGIAYATGPNYNLPWDFIRDEDVESILVRGRRLSLAAQRYASTPVEKALAAAIMHRFPEIKNRDWTEWNLGYANAMKVVYEQFGQQDLDVAALYADSLMNLAPWQLWDLHSGAPEEACRTAEAKVVLEKALKNPKSTTHPGLLHLYIHLMELSPTPEAALPAADRLRGLVPDSGHLNHMPGHIDIWIGDYRRAIDSNLKAMVADDKYMDVNIDSHIYASYRLHDYSFVIYAAMFCGQYHVAIETALGMERCLTERLLRATSPIAMVDMIEGFVSFRAHVLIRFGKWDEVLKLQLPADQSFYCVTTSLVHYARGIAHAVLGNISESERERELFHAARATVPPTRMELVNKWQDVLGVPEAMLDGELEYRKGNYHSAFTHLQLAIDRYDNLIYAEPWSWMQPPRHAYAALKLEQGEVEEAAKVYAQDLGYDHTIARALRHPNNVWALHGYHECLLKLGRMEEARIVEPQLTLAAAVADVPIESSCFCRRVMPSANQCGCA